MGTCCSKTDNSRVEFDNINKDKDVTAAKNKNNYTKDPTNLPSGGQTTHDTENTVGHGGMYGLNFLHHSIAIFIFACIQVNFTYLKLCEKDIITLQISLQWSEHFSSIAIFGNKHLAYV